MRVFRRGMRAMRAVCAGAIGLGALAAGASCGGPSQVGLSQSCSLNSDCDSPLVCVFSRCHQQCKTSEDCASGERCVASGNGGDEVCQLAQESSCSGGAGCAGNEVCTPIDLQCRMGCQSSLDCRAGQYCVSVTANTTVCYQSNTPSDTPVLEAVGAIAIDGAALGDGGASLYDAVGLDVGAQGGDGNAPGTDGHTPGSDGNVGPGSDAGGDSTLANDAAPPACATDAFVPDGACYFCPPNACSGHGTCVNGSSGYTCKCNGGYIATDPHTCTLLNACLANDTCSLGYACEPTAPPGEACLGQFATWPVPDPTPPAGSTTRAPSYANNGDGTVSDEVTGLMWQKVEAANCVAGDAAPSPDCTHSDAAAYCAGLALGGYGDWRLPTRVELESLLDCSPDQPPFLGTVFQPISGRYYWASSLDESSPTSFGWFVDFVGCEDNTAPLGATNVGVRCVRGLPIGPNTAATHYTINPGAIDGGAPDAAIVGDSVTDNWTGLTWARTVPSSTFTVAAGMAYCASLGGGFRLPTLKEMATLFDPTHFNPALDSATFPGDPQGGFWTSTLLEPANGSYYSVSSALGRMVGASGGANVNYIRCVH